MDYYTQEYAENQRTDGIKIPVRFFKYANIDGEIDLIEISPHEFESLDCPIEYERHGVFANGTRQICLIRNTMEN